MTDTDTKGAETSKLAFTVTPPVQRAIEAHRATLRNEFRRIGYLADPSAADAARALLIAGAGALGYADDHDADRVE